MKEVFMKYKKSFALGLVFAVSLTGCARIEESRYIAQTIPDVITVSADVEKSDYTADRAYGIDDGADNFGDITTSQEGGVGLLQLPKSPLEEFNVVTETTAETVAVTSELTSETTPPVLEIPITTSEQVPAIETATAAAEPAVTAANITITATAAAKTATAAVESPATAANITITASTSAVPAAVTKTAAGLNPDNAPAGAAEEENGILVYPTVSGHYAGVMGVWGTYAAVDSLVSAVGTFARTLPSVRFYAAVMPFAAEFYIPEENKAFSVKEKPKSDYMAEKLAELGYGERVRGIDVFVGLTAEVNRGKQLYPRTDHHWLPLGAYYAAQSVAAAMGAAFPDISEYKAVTRGGYVGSMYIYSKDIRLKNDPEDYTIYIPPVATPAKYYDKDLRFLRDGNLVITPDGSNYYSSYIGSDDVVAEITPAHATTGRVLAVLKDSMGNGIVPFLTSGFDKIYVCDLRYFNYNIAKFCEERGVTDVLIAASTYAAAGPSGRGLDRMLAY